MFKPHNRLVCVIAILVIDTLDQITNVNVQLCNVTACRSAIACLSSSGIDCKPPMIAQMEHIFMKDKALKLGVIV